MAELLPIKTTSKMSSPLIMDSQSAWTSYLHPEFIIDLDSEEAQTTYPSVIEVLNNLRSVGEFADVYDANNSYTELMKYVLGGTEGIPMQGAALANSFDISSLGDAVNLDVTALGNIVGMADMMNIALHTLSVDVAVTAPIAQLLTECKAYFVNLQLWTFYATRNGSKLILNEAMTNIGVLEKAPRNPAEWQETLSGTLAQYARKRKTLESLSVNEMLFMGALTNPDAGLGVGRQLKTGTISLTGGYITNFIENKLG